MCIFSNEVSSVANTQIFARASTAEKQFLVYSMHYQADTALAMILPLPTPVAAPENAVRFIDLSAYPTFFDDMAKGFPEYESRAASAGLRSQGKGYLEVHEVGSFEASFVPQRSDWVRLDPRFRLPETVWDQLPRYHDYGFAVFQLKSGLHQMHPMAFEFVRRQPDMIFFPTVHVHHGVVKATADFDHLLYCQLDQLLPGWSISSSSPDGLAFLLAGSFMTIEKTQGLVDGDTVVQRCKIFGVHANEDVKISLSLL